jgi:hypothetical protein
MIPRLAYIALYAGLLACWLVMAGRYTAAKERLAVLEAREASRLTGELSTTDAPEYLPKLILQTSPPVVLEFVAKRGKLDRTPCEQLWQAFHGRDTTAVIKIRFEK